ncbi:hypothetical protein ROZALSC1DRAFT_24530 [Rozella allomycis CSF55]|uniref:DUF4219 domain-containing protein n=1 Tax=Rozella allomycis (strain CSF55) TaxID=988480 RepID=A0A4P9YD60_ROZAC|nr:hypothetical protein ROZALSC1DRAFT_24530 [Rozella allomycis CSF55]
MSPGNNMDLTIAKLTSENYSSWSLYTRAYSVMKLWKIVEKTMVSEKDLNYTKEKNEDYLDALATITLLVSESQIEHIKRAKSSGETWKALECAHGKNSGSSIVKAVKSLVKPI